MMDSAEAAIRTELAKHYPGYKEYDSVVGNLRNLFQVLILLREDRDVLAADRDVWKLRAEQYNNDLICWINRALKAERAERELSVYKLHSEQAERM